MSVILFGSGSESTINPLCTGSRVMGDVTIDTNLEGDVICIGRDTLLERGGLGLDSNHPNENPYKFAVCAHLQKPYSTEVSWIDLKENGFDDIVILPNDGGRLACGYLQNRDHENVRNQESQIEETFRLGSQAGAKEYPEIGLSPVKVVPWLSTPGRAVGHFDPNEWAVLFNYSSVSPLVTTSSVPLSTRGAETKLYQLGNYLDGLGKSNDRNALQAFCVGVDKYPVPIASLRYAASDAAKMSDFFSARGYQPELLTNEMATLEHLEQSLSEQGPIQSDLIFYFAGHGTSIGGERGILLSGGSFLSLNSLNNLLRKYSDNPVVITDCCFDPIEGLRKINSGCVEMEMVLRNSSRRVISWHAADLGPVFESKKSDGGEFTGLILDQLTDTTSENSSPKRQVSILRGLKRLLSL